MRHLILSILILCVATACNREYDPVPDHVTDLFPVQTGNYRTYQVQDTLFNGTQDSLTEAYYLKEEAVGTETDLNGRENLVLWRYRAADAGALPGREAFEYHSLATEYLGESYAERVEDNHRYLIMALPALEGRSWNGNLYNEEGSQNYRIISMDSTVKVGGVDYAHCVVVEKQPYAQIGSLEPGSVLYQEAYAYEIYAPGIGLIKRLEKRLYMQRPSGTEWLIDPDSRFWTAEIVDRNY